MYHFFLPKRIQILQLLILQIDFGTERVKIIGLQALICYKRKKSTLKTCIYTE
jgi:hypothetical protein